MIAGTASVVSSCTLVALRYQVACRASAAKFGNLPASTRRRPSIRLVTGNSSKITTTIGGSRRGAAIDRAFAVPSSLAMGERARNTPRKISGTGASTVRTSGTARVLAYATAKAAPSRAAVRKTRSVECVCLRITIRDDRGQQRDEHEVCGRRSAGRGKPGKRLDADERCRRRDRENECEDDDVTAGGTAGDEELRCLTEQLEEWLRDGKRPQHGEVEGVLPERAAHRGCAR